MNKRGQFYLIVAIIIVMIITVLASVKTYANVNPEPRKLKDISKELKEEGPRIIDYGIYNEKNLTALLNNFDEEFAPYFLKKTEETNIVFLYGNSSDLFAVQYNPYYTGSVYATIGTVAPAWSSTALIANRTKVTPSGGMVQVDILGRNFEFEIRENEMFYFLVSQENEEEIYIEKNE